MLSIIIRPILYLRAHKCKQSCRSVRAYIALKRRRTPYTNIDPLSALLLLAHAHNMFFSRASKDSRRRRLHKKDTHFQMMNKYFTICKRTMRKQNTYDEKRPPRAPPRRLRNQMDYLLNGAPILTYMCIVSGRRLSKECNRFIFIFFLQLK